MTVESIFAHIFAAKANQEFAIKMSYIEINNEQAFDLLNEGEPAVVESLKWVEVTSIDDAI